VLADEVKDSGAVSLFPQLAATGKTGAGRERLGDVHLADFENLAGHYPVTWILTRSPGPGGLICPYRNHDLAVCRIKARVAHFAILR